MNRQAPHYAIIGNGRVARHALCVMANNFTTLLWQKIFHAFENTLAINTSALLPILNQTCTNLKTNYRDALTGPIARKDNHTIQCHLNTLKEDSFYDIYKAFINAAKTNDHT